MVVQLRRLKGETTDLTDEALVAACGAGDSAALGVLFDRYHNPARRFLSRLLGARGDEVEDLIQATFLEVWRSSQKFGRRSAVRTWILGISANLARHHLRSEQRRAVAFGVLSYRPEADSGNDPSDAAVRRQLVDRIGRALQELPHDLKVAFVLCDLEEVQGVEAARVLGVRPGTLWRRLHEARKALRAALEVAP
jgi:RNA polymerase sigma factor (sigma-70 family)